MLFITQDVTNDKKVKQFQQNFLMSRVSEINIENKAFYKCLKYLQDNQRQQSFEHRVIS